VAQIDKAIAEVEQLGPMARYEAIRRIRQAYDGPAKAVYNPSLTADFLTAQGSKFGAADVTSVLREHLANFDPKTAEVNKGYALWKKADDVMQAAEETERVRPTVGRKIVASGFGTVVGEKAGGTLGAILGYTIGPMVDDILRASPTLKVVTARALTELAEALRKGQPEVAITRIKLLKSLALRVGARATADTSTEAQ